jgi:hypothetical protein
MLVPKQVAALVKIAAKEATRYAFNGVYFERGKSGNPRAVVTDGRRALILEWEEADHAEFPPVDIDPRPAEGFKATIPTDDVERAAKSVSKRNCRPILDNFVIDEPNANGTVKLASTDLSRRNVFEATTVEGNFPPIDDVVPKPVVYDPAQHGAQQFTHIRIGFNPMLLAELLKAMAAAACSEESKGVEFIVPIDPSRPLLLRCETHEGRKATGILMPVHLNELRKPDIIVSHAFKPPLAHSSKIVRGATPEAAIDAWIAKYAAESGVSDAVREAGRGYMTDCGRFMTVADAREQLGDDAILAFEAPPVAADSIAADASTEPDGPEVADDAESLPADAAEAPAVVEVA